MTKHEIMKAYVEEKVSELMGITRDRKSVV